MSFYYYNQRDYSYVPYDNPNTSKKETVATSGCGVCSACMVFNNLAQKVLYTVPAMAKFSINCGARDNSGTNEKTLLNALCKANKGFSWRGTTDVNELVKHLKSGGMAICNQGDVYNIFSTAGHFVVADRMVGNAVDILDPDMYAGKYDAYDRPNRIVSKTNYGCVVTTAQLSKATSDRNPAYYLVSYKRVKPKVYGNAKMKSAQNAYCDSDLTEKIGSVGKGERVYYLGTGEGRPMISYQTSRGYKVGFVAKDSVIRD